MPKSGALLCQKSWPKRPRGTSLKGSQRSLANRDEDDVCKRNHKVIGTTRNLLWKILTLH